MVLHSKKRVHETIKYEIIPALKKADDIKQIKPMLMEKALQVIIPEGNPESRNKKIEKNIEAIKQNAKINNIASSNFLESLERESHICMELPYKYTNPNISNAQASQNRCYGFIFAELLEVIKNNPDYIQASEELA